jgi:GNAT superfamily N-acetyltransferase
MRTAPSPIEFLAARPEHARFAAAIAEAIRVEVEGGAIGMALRTPELLETRIREGDAVIAVTGTGDDWAGFCYVAPWEGGAFAAVSALIVRPEYRGAGTARGLKRLALSLARARHPEAKIFGLTTSPAVVRINRLLGFREASYLEITRDQGFWSGCEACPFHETLRARGGRSCHCTAMILEDPGGQAAQSSASNGVRAEGGRS